MTVAELKKQGYRFSLEGDVVKVRRYGAPLDRSLLDGLDRQAIINALQDRAAGFQEAPAQEITVEHEQLPAYCEAIACLQGHVRCQYGAFARPCELSYLRFCSVLYS